MAPHQSGAKKKHAARAKPAGQHKSVVAKTATKEMRRRLITRRVTHTAIRGISKLR